MTQNNSDRQTKELERSFNTGQINSKQLSKGLRKIRQARKRTVKSYQL